MSDYWENRAAWDMYHAMEDAEKTAQKIARIYRKALTQLTYAARDVFDKYRKDYGLSEVEAWELLNKMQDKASIDELLLALRNEKTRKGRQDILKVLEAPAYTSRIERFKDMMRQVDFLMQNVYEQEKQFDTTFLRIWPETATIKPFIIPKDRRAMDLLFLIFLKRNSSCIVNKLVR